MTVGQAQREKSELQATCGAKKVTEQPGTATATVTTVQVLPAGAEWRDWVSWNGSGSHPCGAMQKVPRHLPWSFDAPRKWRPWAIDVHIFCWELTARLRFDFVFGMFSSWHVLTRVGAFALRCNMDLTGRSFLVCRMGLKLRMMLQMHLGHQRLNKIQSARLAACLRHVLEWWLWAVWEYLSVQDHTTCVRFSTCIIICALLKIDETQSRDLHSDCIQLHPASAKVVWKGIEMAGILEIRTIRRN